MEIEDSKLNKNWLKKNCTKDEMSSALNTMIQNRWIPWKSNVSLNKMDLPMMIKEVPAKMVPTLIKMILEKQKDASEQSEQVAKVFGKYWLKVFRPVVKADVVAFAKKYCQDIDKPANLSKEYLVRNILYCGVENDKIKKKIFKKFKEQFDAMSASSDSESDSSDSDSDDDIIEKKKKKSKLSRKLEKKKEKHHKHKKSSKSEKKAKVTIKKVEESDSSSAESSDSD